MQSNQDEYMINHSIQIKFFNEYKNLGIFTKDILISNFLINWS